MSMMWTVLSTWIWCPTVCQTVRKPGSPTLRMSTPAPRGTLVRQPTETARGSALNR